MIPETTAGSAPPVTTKAVAKSLPMARYPGPSVCAPHPMTLNPYCRNARPSDPGAWHPYVIGPTPPPVAGRPHIIWSRRNGPGFYPNRRWRPSNHHVACRWPRYRSVVNDLACGRNSSGTGSGDFARCRCGSGHWHGLLHHATGQHQRSQNWNVNA
jgi:hypothetical protein